MRLRYLPADPSVTPICEALGQAVSVLKEGLARNARDFDVRHLLMEIYLQQGDRASLEALAQDTLRLLPGDSRTMEILAKRG